MGVIRKITSASTLGVVDFRSDKERIARSTRKTSKNTKKAMQQDQKRHEDEMALQAQQLEYQRQQLALQAMQLQQQAQGEAAQQAVPPAAPVYLQPQIGQGVEASEVIACAGCGVANPVGAAFCRECGTGLADRGLEI